MGSSRFARRYSGNRIFFLFLQVLRCFSSLGLPSKRYEFTLRYCSITNSGFPHSEISGSKLTYSSPKHIGVSAVLHRLLVPRHPPCALINLTLRLSIHVVFLRQLHSFNRSRTEVRSLIQSFASLNYSCLETLEIIVMTFLQREKMLDSQFIATCVYCFQCRFIQFSKNKY